MFARVSWFEGPPERTAEGIRLAKERVLPVARLQDGFKGIYLLFDEESGRSLAMTLWESEEAMRASERAARTAKDESARAAGGAVVAVERYAVAAAELAE